MQKTLLIAMAFSLLIIPCIMPGVYAQQMQGQGQLQGQGQQIAGDFGIDDSFNGTAFPNQGNVEYPVAPPHFGGPNYKDHGPNFASVKALLMYNDTFRVVWEDAPERSAIGQAVIGLVKRVKFRKATNNDVEIRLQKTQHWKPGERSERYDAIKAGYEKVEGEVKVLAEGTILANDVDVTSSMILVEAILQAYAAGGNHVHVISEGSQKELNSFGWGLGVSYTRAEINSAGDVGGIASGGTGISGGSARYDSLPWVQFFILEVPEQ